MYKQTKEKNLNKNIKILTNKLKKLITQNN